MNSKKIPKLIFIYLFLTMFLTGEQIFILNYIVSFVFFMFFVRKIPKKIINGIYLILFIVFFGILVTFICGFNSDLYFKDVLRDIMYLLNPIGFLLIGYLFYISNSTPTEVLNSFILIGFLNLIIYYIDLFILGNSNFTVWENLNDFRNITGTGDLKSAVVLGIIFSGIIPKQERLSPIIISLLSLLGIIQLLLQLSRTPIMIIFFIVIVVNYNSLLKILKKRFVLNGALIFLFLIFVYSQRNNFLLISAVTKFGNTFNEISSKNDFSTMDSIQSNWRGFEVESAVQQWKNASISNKLFGFGLGAKVFVGPSSILVDPTSNGWISVLHNGYFTMLIKEGIIGLSAYILFYLSNLSFGIKKFRVSKSNWALLFIALILILSIQTIFLNGLFKDSINYYVVLLIGYFGNYIRINKVKDCVLSS